MQKDKQIEWYEELCKTIVAEANSKFPSLQLDYEDKEDKEDKEAKEDKEDKDEK
jgi:hypothetical protein